MKSSLPKPLHSIAGKTMLERVVDRARGISPDKIIVVYSDERVKEAALYMGCIAVLQAEPLGTADALKKALLECEGAGRILVSCADVPLITSSIYRQLSDRHLQEGNYLTLLTARVKDPAGYGRVIVKEGRVVRIVEEKEAGREEKKIDLINGGVYCIKKKGLEKYLERIGKSPVKGEYYITDLAEITAGDGKKVGFLECRADYVTGVNTPSQLREAEEKIERE